MIVMMLLYALLFERIVQHGIWLERYVNISVLLDLSDGPVELHSNWRQLVHQNLTEKELEHLNNSIKRCAPLGNPSQ